MKCKTLFISDLHIGSKGFNSNEFMTFIRNIECDKLVLVGDIIDFWALKRKIYWPQEHSNVIQKLLKMSKNGTKIVYIPGNHDEVLRDFVYIKLGDNLSLELTHTHTTVSGEKLLCIHGDEFDVIIKNHKILTYLGDLGYNMIMRINPIVRGFRKLLGYRTHWSFSGYVKKKVKEKIKLMSNFEVVLSSLAVKKKCDGVICGHTHIPQITKSQGVTYYNIGDWVDSCTFLIEKFNGELELVEWLKWKYES